MWMSVQGKKILPKAIVIAFATIIGPQAGNAQSACATPQEMEKMLLERYGESQSWMGLRGKSELFVLFRTPRGETWTITHSRRPLRGNKDQLCILAEGKHWEYTTPSPTEIFVDLPTIEDPPEEPSVILMQGCQGYRQMTEGLRDRFNETPRGRGLKMQSNNNNVVVELFYPPAGSGNTWTIITVYPNKNACILAGGNGWWENPPQTAPP